MAGNSISLVTGYHRPSLDFQFIWKENPFFDMNISRKTTIPWSLT